MIFVQQVRANDIIDDSGKQVDLNKVFISAFGWREEEYNVTIESDKGNVSTVFKKVRREDSGYTYYREIGLGYPFKTLLRETIGLFEFDYFILSRIGGKKNRFRLSYVKQNGQPEICRLLENLLSTVRGHFVGTIAGSSVSRSCKHLQKIFYGAPGTGKSHKIDYDLFYDEDTQTRYGLKKTSFQEDQIWRTTFHPDYDYAQFVGCFKPKSGVERVNSLIRENIENIEDTRISSEEKKAVLAKLENGSVSYGFQPQVFAEAYIEAWKKFLDEGTSNTNNQVYLVVEEINRGNCAQIFGDIFQLLDRDDYGLSQYVIDADQDFYGYVMNAMADDGVNNNAGVNAKDRVVEYEKMVGVGKLRFPPNLNILATMNTSDQSLYPMDSAFKRRFDWEYVSINYDNDVAKNFVIELIDPNELNKRLYYSWVDFLYVVNANIEVLTYSEDKQMGEFFVKPNEDSFIDKDSFRSKVLFYLWDSVYKDERDHEKNIVFKKQTGFSKFQKFFGKDENENLQKFMENLGFDGTKYCYRLKYSDGKMKVFDLKEIKQEFAIETVDEASVRAAAQLRGIEAVKVLKSNQRL